jgi:hypothetical protein
VRYPTRKLLRCLQRKPPGTDFWLPGLTGKEAWLLTEFLDEIQEAIWMDYGKEIAAYLDRDDIPDSCPSMPYGQGNLEF